MSDLSGKAALVTASSRGIGRSIAERLARGGAAVTVNYHESAEAAKEVVAGIESRGGRAVAVRADVSDLTQLRALYDDAESAHGPLDIVVNNHASPSFGPIAETSEDDFDRIFSVTARSTFFSLREAARRISDGGRIVNISAGGTVARPAGGGAYHGAKAAVEQFTAALSKELGPRGVTVNAVLPGATRTDGLIIPEQMVDELVSQTSLGRLGEPDDVAAVVAFLASDDGRWLTGQLLRATGGLV